MSMATSDGGFRSLHDAWRHYAKLLEQSGPAGVASAQRLLQLLGRGSADVQDDARAVSRAVELRRTLADPRGMPAGAADRLRQELLRLRESHRELLADF